MLRYVIWSGMVLWRQVGTWDGRVDDFVVGVRKVKVSSQ